MVKHTYSEQEISEPTSGYSIIHLEEITKTKTTTTKLRPGQPIPQPTFKPGTSRK
jgi:hypothetical protein